ncbi:MAG: glycoside hydrolase family 9 protein [Verrucomicrobiales bacterium]
MLFPFPVFIFSIIAFFGLALPGKAAVITDVNPLSLPRIGDYGLRVISPQVLEVTLINTKSGPYSPVSSWNFINNQKATLPEASQFVATVNGQIAGVQSVGFKRRPLFAPETPGDLRIGNHLYLKLAAPVPNGALVEVKNPSGSLWGASMRFIATAHPNRLSPAIHVNQVGYMPTYPKKAMVGYYLGSMGELPISSTQDFLLLRKSDGQAVHVGNLKQRLDKGFAYTPLPYQQVLEADFTQFTTPGEYLLQVPGLGVSFPFRIHDGITANFARTFALGLYHQRCGGATLFPYTRHSHADCHTAAAEVPTMDSAFAKTQEFLASLTEDYKVDTVLGPRHTAPQLKNTAASLYPFQKQGMVDVRGGHHDAGDYSKYTINSASLVHSLVFAVDSFAGVGGLDNLGLPESGDGKSDILQEAKWEADFLAKLQDNDGGFYFLVYPKNQRYENRVLPENGLPQVVWPKNTAVSAAAVAALAEAGSSPLMKAQFPAEASVYMQKARLGWNFLMQAIAKHGKDGSYQKITHYGNEFMHDDELSWAAAAMYAATGEAQYQQKLFEFFPNPNAVSARRWSWWKLFEGYGNAVRTYAFAASSGRLPAAKLDPSYLAKCQAEIIATAEDHVRFSKESAYGTSFPEGNKAQGNAGWYFSSERAFDVTVAYQLRPQASYLEAVVANFNYEAGSNPLNMTFITGIGAKRQRDIVNQYAWNDHRILPPAGIPLGNVQQTGYGYLEVYTKPVVVTENGVVKTNWVNYLPELSYPFDHGNANYAFYDRWTDMINTTAEFVVMDQARCLGSLAFWMAQGAKKDQPWKPIQGTIVGLNGEIKAGAPATLLLAAQGIDLSEAQVVWEMRFQEPLPGNPITFQPKFSGDHWVEAEALLPDGRRIVARGSFSALTSDETAPNSYQSAPLNVNSKMSALYHVDGNGMDAAGKQQPLVLSGNTRIERSNLGWMADRTAGGALRFLDLGDEARVQIPVSTLVSKPASTAVVLEAMIYINELKAFSRGSATILSLEENDWSAYLEFFEDKYRGLIVEGGTSFSLGNATLAAALTTKTWHHLSLAITQSGYVVQVNGNVIAEGASQDYNYWGRAQTATLRMGNFDGWIDEIVIRNSEVEEPDASGVLTPLGVNSSGFRMRLTGELGSSYLIQSSSDGKVWTNVMTQKLDSNPKEVTAPISGAASYLFYRALRQ